MYIILPSMVWYVVQENMTYLSKYSFMQRSLVKLNTNYSSHFFSSFCWIKCTLWGNKKTKIRLWHNCATLEGHQTVNSNHRGTIRNIVRVTRSWMDILLINFHLLIDYYVRYEGKIEHKNQSSFQTVHHHQLISNYNFIFQDGCCFCMIVLYIKRE